MTGTLSGIRVPIFGGPLAEGRSRTGTVAAIVAVVITGGAAAVPGVAPAEPAETQPDNTTDDIPDLPDLRGIDGSSGSLVNRNLGTGDQAFCADLGGQLEELMQDWDDARQAAENARAGGDDVEAGVARATANTLRFTFANVNAANVQCLKAADAALTSSPDGSVTGSLRLS